MKPRSLSFLLRLWHVKENDHWVYRYSLESSHSGERWGFADLDARRAFLRNQTDNQPYGDLDEGEISPLW
ncbi:MAG: hypothetical protein E4H27_02475 [Anaerolineales bacterium]|nr:MAG: hypothetical protein E4H27_02475 [Anaerolineales bacterium]